MNSSDNMNSPATQDQDGCSSPVAVSKGTPDRSPEGAAAGGLARQSSSRKLSRHNAMDHYAKAPAPSEGIPLAQLTEEPPHEPGSPLKKHRGGAPVPCIRNGLTMETIEALRPVLELWYRRASGQQVPDFVLTDINAELDDSTAFLFRLIADAVVTGKPPNATFITGLGKHGMQTQVEDLERCLAIATDLSRSSGKKVRFKHAHASAIIATPPGLAWDATLYTIDATGPETKIELSTVPVQPTGFRSVTFNAPVKITGESSDVGALFAHLVPIPANTAIFCQGTPDNYNFIEGHPVEMVNELEQCFGAGSPVIVVNSSASGVKPSLSDWIDVCEKYDMWTYRDIAAAWAEVTCSSRVDPFKSFAPGLQVRSKTPDGAPITFASLTSPYGGRAGMDGATLTANLTEAEPIQRFVTAVHHEVETAAYNEKLGTTNVLSTATACMGCIEEYGLPGLASVFCAATKVARLYFDSLLANVAMKRFAAVTAEAIDAVLNGSREPADDTERLLKVYYNLSVMMHSATALNLCSNPVAATQKLVVWGKYGVKLEIETWDKLANGNIAPSRGHVLANVSTDEEHKQCIEACQITINPKRILDGDIELRDKMTTAAFDVVTVAASQQLTNAVAAGNNPNKILTHLATPATEQTDASAVNFLVNGRSALLNAAGDDLAALCDPDRREARALLGAMVEASLAEASPEVESLAKPAEAAECDM